MNICTKHYVQIGVEMVRNSCLCTKQLLSENWKREIK